MPPKNTRKAKENGEETESEDHMVASPLASESSYASSISSAPTVASFTPEMLQSILASRDTTLMSMFATLVPATTVAVTTPPPPPPPPRAQVKIPKWSDGEIPSAYFTKLEKALTLNGVPRSEWGQNIHVHLSGRAQDALAQVPLLSIDDYDVIKDTILDALGDTPDSADRSWWSMVRKSGEDACAFYLRIRACGIMRMQGLISKEEILEKLVLSRFLSLLSQDCYTHATDRRPKDGLEAAKIVHEFEERRAYTRERSGWRQDHHRHNLHSSRREPNSSNSPNNSGTGSGSSSGGTGNANSGSSTGSSNSSSGAGLKEVTGNNSSSGASASGGSRHSGRSDMGGRKPVICHNCGEPGHIRPNCPNRVRSVRSPESVSLIEVSGWLAGVLVKDLQIDTGACRTVVSSKYIPRSAYLGKSITLDSWRGRQYSEHKLAKITIKVGDVSTDAVVAVAEHLDCPALLGTDLGAAMTVQLTGIVHAKAKVALSKVNNEVPMQDVKVNDEVPMHDETVEQVSVTRAQAKKAAAEDRENDIASAQSECDPVALADVLDLPDSYFEPDEAFDATAIPVGVSSEWPEIDSMELPLPDMGGDVAKLGEEQKSDSSVNVEVPMQIVNDGVPKQDVVRVNRSHPKQAAAEEQANEIAPAQAESQLIVEFFGFPVSSIEPDKAPEALVRPDSAPDEWPQAVNVKVEVPMHGEVGGEEVACRAPPVVLEDIFCFDDSLFEPVDACDAPTVVMDDIFSLSVFPFGPDLSGFEFPLPELDDDVLEASVAPACGDTFVVPRQLTDVNKVVLEVLEASVAPVCCSNFVVPRHLEEVHDEVLEAGVASADCVEIVVPTQQVVVKVDVAVDWMAPADAVSDAVSDTVDDYFNLPEEFVVEGQADVVASGPVDCKPMVGLDVAVFVDDLSETDPALAPMPIAWPEPETVVNLVILAMEDSIPPKSCWQSPTVLVDHCPRFMCCYTKATGKFAPGSCAVIRAFDMFILMISAICSFCSCISMCLSKFLVVLFFGAFGPRAVPLLHGLDKPPWRMLGAPSVPWILDWLGGSLLPYEGLPVASSPATFGQPEGGGDVMESPSQYQQLPNIQLTCQLEHTNTLITSHYILLLFTYQDYHLYH